MLPNNDPVRRMEQAIDRRFMRLGLQAAASLVLPLPVPERSWAARALVERAEADPMHG